MEDLVQKVDVIEERSNGSDLNQEENELFIDSIEDMCQPSNSSSDTSTTSEAVTNEEQSQEASSQDSSSSPQLGWPIKKSEAQNFSVSDVNGDEEKSQFEDKTLTVKNKQRSKNTEIEMMKERFSKLLLGEDMSGSGEGVCTAFAISNAITNLCATLFGQLWRLEPLPPEKKAMWRREMEWLLCVSDHIVELVPSWQTFPDGSKLEVMTCRPRSDLYVNLPALRKLDHMLLEVLDSFSTKEFWYVDQGILAPDADGSVSLRRPTKRQEEKWWLPVPCVPPGGLHESSRRHLQHKRECTNQILKAAMAINNNALDEMEVPESYLQSLPKNGKASLGDVMHKYMTSDHFSPECLLDCLALSSEYQVLEIANRVESSIYVWRQRGNPNVNRSASKSSWSMVKELMVDTDKRELLVDRAVSLLICLKQRFPGLPQTTLDMNKIQYNKDVGKSILEGYSRVLESLASNIMARIDDLLYVDDLSRHSDQFLPVPAASVMAHQRIATPYLVPASSTQYSTAYINPSFSPSPMVRQFGNSNDSSHRGLGMKKGINNRVHDANEKIAGNPVEESDSIPLSIWETDVQNGVH